MTTQLPLDNFFGTLTAADRTNSGNVNFAKDSNVSPGTPLGRVNEKDAEEESVYEKPTDQVVIHSVNCQELIGCNCTPKSDSDKFAEERAAAIRRLHAGRNERARRAKSIRQLNSKPQETQQDDWNPFPTMEDFEK